MNRCFYSDLNRILKYANANFRKKINVNDIAKHAGYTSWHCNLLFQEYYGERLGEYLTSLRMKEARKLLDSGFSIGRVAKTLNYSPRGILKAFRTYYGVSPSEYVKTGKTLERYPKTYEWNPADDNWGKGENPTSDGLWEFAYYNPATQEYALMEWFDRFQYFRAPIPKPNAYNHPNWHCRNRDFGNGMHPGKATQAVRTFRCPHSGTVEVFFSFGRDIPIKKNYTPCSAQLFHNDRALTEDVVMKTAEPVQFRVICTVRAGDTIRFHLDPMGYHRGDGTWLYRQQIRYLEISE